MLAPRPQRGRPKGTGIDDRQRLAEIARAVAANPDLKPTTAIRSLGISNPSIIRRLRDKYNACRLELERELKVAAATPTADAVKPQLRIIAPAAAVAERGREHAPAPSQAAEIPAGLHHLTADAAATLAMLGKHETLGPMAAWFGLGVVAAASAIEQQLAISQQLMRLPAVASLIKQQMAVAELVLSLSGRSREMFPGAAPLTTGGQPFQA